MRWLPRSMWPLLALVLFWGPAALAEETPANVEKDHPEKFAQGLKVFKESVRPVLVERCLDCHGNGIAEGKLDISTREKLIKGGAAGPAVIPGKSQESWLFKLVAHLNQPHMPYDEDKLPEEQIAAIGKWIDLGAPYDKPLLEEEVEVITWTEKTVPPSAREFWSFQPLNRTAPPNVQTPAWCETPIDRFILQKLETAKLSPNPPVAKAMLIRRVYLDLIGIPPTPAQVDAFLNDPAPEAYERMVDELLANPHYGERWGRHWLDLARFAESHGFEHDYDRPTAYHYRDYVIKALNADQPYDQFVKWQLAGDEFAPKDPLAMMATGFLAAGVHSTQITANEVEKHRYDELDDIVNTTGTAFLGLTIGCARCHDHKFDPIPARDYYQMVSAFTTTVRSEVELDLRPEEYQKRKAIWEQEHAPLVKALQEYEANMLPGGLARWEQNRQPGDVPGWIILDIAEAKSDNGTTFEKQQDGSLLATGPNPAFEKYTFTIKTTLTGLRTFRLEALKHESMVKGGPGRAGNGNIALTDIWISAAPLDGSAEPVNVSLLNPRATFEQRGLPVAATIDEDGKSAWAVDPEFGKDHAAVYDFGTEIGFPGGTVLTVHLAFENNTGHNIGRPRLSVSTQSSTLELLGTGVSQNVLTALESPAEKRTPEQKTELVNWYKPQDQGWRTLNQKVEQHKQQAPKPDTVKVLVSSEGLPAVRLHSQGADFFEQTFFLRRGDPDQKEGVAPVGFLQVLTTPETPMEQWEIAPPQGSKLSYRRTALANWITDLDEGAGNLLARVIVNRLWQHHMGHGIVATPSDFGSRGAPPTHPELLDWLASELIRHNWQLKPIHRLILLSATYRQNSDSVPEKFAADPTNELFWRQDYRRLEAEVIRDSLLAISGQLEQPMFGPGTLNEGQKRRSIYFTVKRSQMISMLQIYDLPEALTGVAVRPSTTIAPQALWLLNNTHVRDLARSFAQRIAADETVSLEDAVKSAYQMTLCRQPTAEELQGNLTFLNQQIAAYQAEGNPNARVLALTDFCQTMFCLNELIYVE